MKNYLLLIPIFTLFVYSSGYSQDITIKLSEDTVKNNNEQISSYDMDELVIKIPKKKTKQSLKEMHSYHSKNMYNAEHAYRNIGEYRYSRIVETDSITLDMRDEFGIYYSSGNNASIDDWDLHYSFYTVPEYMARSYSITTDGYNILDKQYSDWHNNYEPKIDELIRIVCRYGPLFADYEVYDYEPVGSQREIGIVKFKTNPEAFPNETRIFAEGTLRYNIITSRLVDIDFDYIYAAYYNAERLPKYLNEYGYKFIAKMSFKYDADGVVYVDECSSTCVWRQGKTPTFFIKPARRYPHKTNLVEKEYLIIEPYKSGTYNLQDGMANVIAGKYDEEFFSDKPFPIPSVDNFTRLKSFNPLEIMFEENSDVAIIGELYSGDRVNEIIEAKESLFNNESREVFKEKLRRRRVLFGF